MNMKTQVRIVYFDSFGVEHIPKENNKFICSKELGSAVNNDIKSSTFRICGYCVRIFLYRIY